MAINTVLYAGTSQLGNLKAYLITFSATSDTYQISTGVKTAATGAAIAQSIPTVNGVPVCELPSFNEVRSVFMFQSGTGSTTASALKTTVITASDTDSTLASIQVVLSSGTRLVSLLVLGY